MALTEKQKAALLIGGMGVAGAVGYYYYTKQPQPETEALSTLGMGDTSTIGSGTVQPFQIPNITIEIPKDLFPTQPAQSAQAPNIIYLGGGGGGGGITPEPTPEPKPNVTPQPTPRPTPHETLPEPGVTLGDAMRNYMSTQMAKSKETRNFWDIPTAGPIYVGPELAKTAESIGKAVSGAFGAVGAALYSLTPPNYMGNMFPTLPVPQAAPAPTTPTTPISSKTAAAVTEYYAGYKAGEIW